MNTSMKHLMRKEWLKLRQLFWIALLVNCLVMGYIFLDIRHLFQIEHAEMLYYQANRIGRIFYSDLKYLPLLTGISIAVAQFAPEVNKGRMRLSMHLPISLTVLALTYLIIGLGVLSCIFAINGLLLYLIIGVYFPQEFALSALKTALPWLIAGIAAYLGATMAILEPQRKRQVFNLCVAVGLVWLCYVTDSYGAYGYSIWGIILLIAVMIPASFLPIYRFRDGGI